MKLLAMVAKNKKPPKNSGEVLDAYQFKPRAIYPWEVWTDGSTRRLTRSQHFPQASVKTFSISVYAVGLRMRKKGINVHASCHIEDEDHVVIQFEYLDKNSRKKAKDFFKKGFSHAGTVSTPR